MLAFHKERNAEGTLLVTKARDTGAPGMQCRSCRSYGLIVQPGSATPLHDWHFALLVTLLDARPVRELTPSFRHSCLQEAA